MSQAGLVTFVRKPIHTENEKRSTNYRKLVFSAPQPQDPGPSSQHFHSLHNNLLSPLVRGEGPAALPLLAGLGAALGDDGADPGRDDHVAADVDHVPVDHHVEPVGPV